MCCCGCITVVTVGNFPVVCVKDLGPKIFRAGLRYEQNRVVYKIEAQGRVYPVLFLNKIGLFVESTFWAPSLALFRGVEHRKNGLGCCTHTRRSGFRRQNAFWRRFADVRKRAPSRKKRYPILLRNHPGIPDFVNFPFIIVHNLCDNLTEEAHTVTSWQITHYSYVTSHHIPRTTYNDLP